MDAELGPLLPLFERERAAGRAMALGILIDTEGSTYRKAGAMLLISADGEHAGLISGGCLEGDLAERARAVIGSGQAAIVTYDLRNEDDLLWGLGLGCEGAMHVLLLRVGPREEWQPLAHLATALAAHSPTAIGVVTESRDGTPAMGALLLPPTPGDATAHATRTLPAGAAALLEPQPLSALAQAPGSAGVGRLEGPGARWRLMLLPLTLPPRLLVLGAGPDALPVVALAAHMHWRVTVSDHRPAYAIPSHFPMAERVLLTRTEDTAQTLDLAQFTAAVVMSHHLPSDLHYLRALSGSSLAYVGLLGPAARREKLLSELGADGPRLRPRLYAPVGLKLGGRTPEAVALAIVAEIHAFIHSSGKRSEHE